ncbi:MAG: hypothetical protein Q9174_007245 [Haloplaca sp. 1 TL-2023]
MRTRLLNGFRVFAHRIPEILHSSVLGATRLLSDFHQQVHHRAQELGRGMAGLDRLAAQLGVRQAIFETYVTAMKAAITGMQKDSSREFVPLIRTTLVATYNDCASERGPGCFKRMKDKMYASVEEKRHTMFQASANIVKGKLEAMMNTQGEYLKGRLSVAMQGFRQDYTTVFGTLETETNEALNTNTSLRDEVKRIFEDYDGIFQRMAGDPEESDGTGEVTDTAEREDVNEGMETDDLHSDALTTNHYFTPEGQSPTDEMGTDGSAAAGASPREHQPKEEVTPKKEQE